MLRFDERYMRRALELARQAQDAEEVPIGAIVVLNDVVIGEGFNSVQSNQDPTAHAECVALRAAGITAANYRLPETTLYVTVEPCLMCIGAIVNARVQRLVYGTHEPKMGAVESNLKGLQLDHLNHQVQVTRGVLADECRMLMQEFFRSRRRVIS